MGLRDPVRDDYVQMAEDMPFADLTKRIIKACFDVSNELGAGFVESVYRRSLAIVLREEGLLVQEEMPLSAHFRKQEVGRFVADIVVEGDVLLELKATKEIAPEHHAQVINYLNATGLDIGLLVNFGCPRVVFRRFHRRGSQPGRDV